MTRVPVWTRAPAYVAALGQLAGTAERVSRPRGAVCVVAGGQDWTDAALEAIRDGALAVVIDDPEPTLPERLDELRGAHAPILVDRPRLRADAAAQTPPPGGTHLFVAEATGGSEHHHAIAQDAVGWVRVLAGEPVHIAAVARTPAASIAAGATAGGIPVSLTITRGGQGGWPAIDVLAIGPERTEVRMDAASGDRLVSVASADGVRTAAPSWEAGSRLSLRRAIASLEGPRPTDLDELRHDADAAVRVLGAMLAV